MNREVESSRESEARDAWAQACGVLDLSLQVVRPTLSMAPVKLAKEWRVLPH
jgi:hypothetical protein